MTLDDLKQYYADLLIIQYKSKPKAIATMKLLANASLCDGLPQSLQTCFNLDTATGVQLDIIGKIVGVPRNVYGIDLLHTFFAFTTYSGTPAGLGFGRYTDDPYSTSLFRRYFTDATYALSDFEMRTLIKLKIIYNNAYSSFKEIEESLYPIFGPGLTIRDNADFTMTYDVFPPYNNAIAVAAFLNILPKPMGVALTINYETSSSSSSSSSCRSSSSSSSCRSSSSSSCRSSSCSSCRSSSCSSSSSS